MSAKKKFEKEYDTNKEKTFYGISTGAWYLNGKQISGSGLKGENGEVIRKKINVDHFIETKLEIDLLLNLNNDGSLAMKRVNYSSWFTSYKYEVFINGINKCPDNTNGWIPCFVFSSYPYNKQSLQCARINKEYYGKSLNSNW